jgi:DNA-binding XRE family transcriptional regulator
MSARMKEHPTKTVCTLTFVGPVEHVEVARDALHTLGFEEVQETVPWRKAFPAWSDAQLPGVALAGARTKEGVTQVQLAQMTGIPQRHISEMEHGKRAIGKERAKKLAEVLKIDYHVFL